MKWIKRQSRQGWWFLGLVGLMALPGRASGPPNGEIWKSLNAFRADVRKVYEELRFQDVDIKVNGVQLQSVPFGYAFAYFDRSNAQRWLMVNERLLYDQFKIAREAIEASNVPDADKSKQLLVLQERTLDKIRGLIAHEWSHHFLGHTFERISRLNERDADIMTGRILYDFYNRGLANGQHIDTLGLRRSLEVTNFFTTKVLDRFHLPKEARSVLIQKGYVTAWLLNLLKVLPSQLNYEYELRKSETARKLDSLQNAVSLKKQITIKDITQQLNKAEADSSSSFAKKKSLRQDTIRNLIAGFAIESLSDNLLSDSTISTKFNSLNHKISDDSVKLHVYSTNLKKIKSDRIAEENRKAATEIEQGRERIKKEVESQIEIYKSDSYEPLYNIFYLNGNSISDKARGNKDLYNKILSSYQVKHSEDTLKVKILNFSLKGSVNFAVSITRKKVIIYQSSKKEVNLLNSEKNKFPYKFSVDNSDYFLDTNFNLWTETIGAPAIDNMLFLQPYSLSNK